LSIKKLILASSNSGKIREFSEILGGQFDIIPLSETGFNGKIEETGETFLENALIKAKTVYEFTLIPTIADDSGLCAEALNGGPGIRSSRYSRDGATAAENNELLLKNLRNSVNRNAKFVCHIVLYLGLNDYITAFGETRGTILRDLSGISGFGYDPLFYSFDLKKSFAEATAAEKNSVSHRYRAITELKQKLLNTI
jgi:XTP/dITP diphosphohydrolase